MRTAIAVIVNYRTPKELAIFLESIERHQHDQKYSIYWMVVNICGTEEDHKVADAFEQRNLSDRMHFKFTTNIGYAKAVNACLTGQGEEFYVALNSDMRILDSNPDPIGDCIDLMKTDDRIGIVGPRQVEERGRLTHAGIFGTGANPQMRGWMNLDRGQFNDVLPAVTVSGSAFVVRRDCWEELAECTIYRDYVAQHMPQDPYNVVPLGAFLPTQHYYEETACAYHARSHAWAVLYNGATVLEHRWHKSSPVGGEAERIWLPESRKHFRGFCEAHGLDHD